MHDMPKFNSIEEVKEFISGTDTTSVGSIVFSDKEGNFKKLSMKEFVEHMGLDEAAEFIYKLTQENKISGFEVSRDEILQILDKYKKDPDSFTEEEKLVLSMIIEDNKTLMSKSNDIITIIIKTFLDNGTGITDNLSGLLSIMLTLMENLFVLNSDLAVHATNSLTREEIARSVIDQIVIPEGIDESSLLLGLIHVIGNRYIGTKFGNDMYIDYHEFSRLLGLNMEFLYGEKDGNEEPEKTINEPEKVISLDSKKVNLDIRKTLKQNRK